MAPSRIWIAHEPPGAVRHGGPTVAPEEHVAEYRDMGWRLDGPYVLVEHVAEWLRMAKKGQGIMGDEGAWKEAASAVAREFGEK